MLPITQNMQIMQILQIFVRNALSADAYPHCLALPVSLCIALPCIARIAGIAGIVETSVQRIIEIAPKISSWAG